MKYINIELCHTKVIAIKNKERYNRIAQCMETEEIK